MRLIGSLAGLIFAGETTTELLAALDQPAVRIVSLTVTENGYCLDPATKRLNPTHELVRADCATPERPCSAIGVITAALRRRRQAGVDPFTVLSCDNIQSNGAVLRRAVLDLAILQDQATELADWIADTVSFPSTMVDRITPVTTAADIEAPCKPTRSRGPLAGRLRDVHAMGDRGPLPGRAAGLGAGRRAVRRRR